MDTITYFLQAIILMIQTLKWLLIGGALLLVFVYAVFKYLDYIDFK